MQQEEREMAVWQQRGWRAMRQTLDKEMPKADSPYRRWMWILLALLLSFSLGHWYGRVQQRSSDAHAQTQATISPTPTYEQARTVVVEPTSPSSTYIPTYISNLLPKKFWLPATPSSLLAKDVLAESPIVNAANTVYNQNPPAALTALTKDITSPILVSILPEGPLPFALPDRYPTPKRQTWNVGVTAGMLSRRATDVSGTAAGLTFDWQPLRHWGIRTHAGYVYHHQLIQEVKTVYMPFNDYNKVLQRAYGALSPIVDLSNTQKQLIDSEIELPIWGTHRVEGDLSLYWQPNKYWRWYGGAYAGRTVGVSISRPKLPLAALSAAGVVSDINENRAVRADVNAYVAAQLPVWFSGWTSGIGYRPFKHWEFVMSYQRAWPNLRKASTDNYRWNPSGSNGFGRYWTIREGDFPGRLQVSATYFLR